MGKEKFKLRSNRLYALYRAIGLDLLFFATYYKQFLREVKGFEDSELSILTIVGCLMYVVLEPLLIKLISKLGNTKSIRLGNIMWLLALTLMAFPTVKIFIYLGYTIYQVSFLFKVVEPIISRNNLSIENREEEFSTIQGKTCFIYSVCTAIIMLITGAMFDYNHYSIVYACYVTTTILTILSFLIRDEKEYIEEPKNVIIEKREVPKPSKNVLFSSLVVMIFLCGFMYVGVIGTIFTDCATLLKNENIMHTVVTVYIFFGRISRMMASMFYGKIYKKLGSKLLVIMPIILITCLMTILLTGLFVTNSTVRIIIFVIAIVLMYALRDPFELCIQDTIFNYVDKEDRRVVVSANSLFYKVGLIVTNLVCAFVLNSFQQKQYISFGFMGLMLIEPIIVSQILYRKLKKIDSEKKISTQTNELVEANISNDMVEQLAVTENEEIL